MYFSELPLIEPILKAVADEGYTTPTPIQQQAIPLVLQHRDLIGCAQTGTGKTAAFTIPILQLLHETQKQPHSGKGHRAPKALILTPTRELAIQIDESIAAYGRHLPIRHTVIFGGVSQHSQVAALKAGIDILTATPGRLLDLMQQGFVSLNDIRFFVLDEADRMLDMGFIHDVKRVIVRLPQKRQSLFFSATMPPDVAKLADSILDHPASVSVTPVSSTADTIQQQLYFVGKEDKRKLLVHLLNDKAIRSVLVFARTKHGADRVAKDLAKAGIQAEAIHGNKSQNARQRALSNFKNRTTRVLVATDIAARGIDVDELTHVINYELPNIPETYVHRIGRTGRAGNDGIAISFCDSEETAYLKDIHKLIGKTVPVVDEHPYVLDVDTAKVTPAPPAQRSGQRNGQAQRQPSRPNQPLPHKPQQPRMPGAGAPAAGAVQTPTTDNRTSSRRNRQKPRPAEKPIVVKANVHKHIPPKPEKTARGTGNSRYLSFGPDKNY